MKNLKIVLVVLTVLFSQWIMAAEVSLYRAVSQVGGAEESLTQSVVIDVLVENIAYEKNIIAFVEEAPGTWVERQAVYRSSVGNNLELWRVDYDLPENTLADLRFALRYDVAGQSYWDNNGGYDYYLDQDEGYMLGANANIADVSFNSQVSTGNRATYHYSGALLLKNHNPSKKVFVVYSVNDWESWDEVAATYAGGPNFDGIEKWTFRDLIVTRGNDLDYAIRYEVNGVEYWDNNFGNDYHVMFTWFPPLP